MENVTKETNQEYLNQANSFIEASNFCMGSYFAVQESMRELHELNNQLFFKKVKNLKSIVSYVHIIVPNKVVEVFFVDGSRQKAVCSNNDTFSLDLAISICITKNLLGGTGEYNKAVDHGVKVYEKRIVQEEINKENEERIKAKKAKQALKKAERITRRKAEEKEQMIEIQKEAIIRAEREMRSSNILNK